MNFLSPNIGRNGRIFRAVLGVAQLVAALLLRHIWWFALILAACGIFTLVEAFRGWCLLRACGIKTRL